MDAALRATYTACVGIDDEMQHLKTMAGINTAVTSVGTAAGAGAIATGFVKANKDKQISVKLEKLREIEQQNPGVTSTDGDWDNFSAALDSELAAARTEIEQYRAQIEKLNKQSKRLGNWRTGLIAGNTATNIAGAAIAGTNKVDKDLQQQINDCRASVANLRNAMMQARLDGADVTEAESIITACAEYDYVDVSKINNRARGAMISGVVGAATGTAGTVTSAMANTNKIRNDDSDAGQNKEKNLNTAANVLSIGATASSVSATVFNATQISAIKKVAAVSEKCTEVLK